MAEMFLSGPQNVALGADVSQAATGCKNIWVQKLNHTVYMYHESVDESVIILRKICHA